jgi:hypothetical protein
MFYAVPITLLILPSDFMMLFQYGLRIFIFAPIDFLISLAGLLAMYLHIWDKKLFVPGFWRIYAFVYIIWDFSFNILIEPAVTHEPFNPGVLFTPLLLLPLYYSVFRYAFRKWPQDS